MGKLSHIEDIERRKQQQELPHEEGARQSDPAQRREGRPADEPSVDMSARQEADYHGLNTREPMSAGHKFLIILAVFVSVAAILYIVNTWVHFV